MRTMYEKVNDQGQITGKVWQNLEIATYTNYSDSKFEDFVIETKFSDVDSYDEKTIFLFIIDNTKQQTINIKTAHKNIASTGKKNEVYVIAKNWRHTKILVL